MNADNNLDEVLRFEEMNIEIQLTDELSGSLRSLKVSSKTHWENNLYKQSIFFCLKKKLALKHYGPIKPYQIKYSYLFYNYFSFKHSVIFPSSILKWPTNGRRKTSQHDFCVRQDSADIEFFVYVKLLLQQKFLL